MVIVQGSKGLSLFYLETKDEDGKYNNLQIQVCVVYISCTNCIYRVWLVKRNIYFCAQCLKNKLGTRQLPTAELLLDGTTATMVCLYSVCFKCVFVL